MDIPKIRVKSRGRQEGKGLYSNPPESKLSTFDTTISEVYLAHSSLCIYYVFLPILRYEKVLYNMCILETVEKVLYILIVLNEREIMKLNSHFRKPKSGLASKIKRKIK